jgi:hypothetical protein
VNGILFGSLLLATLGASASAQSRWKDIGKTSAGNSVYVDPRSVKAVNGIAPKESVYYSGEAGKSVVERTSIAQPGFGPAIGGSMTQVALDYMCKK